MKTTFFAALILALGCSGQVLTVHNDLGQTGTTTSETKLTPAVFVGSNFRKLGSYAVDGLIFSQPLYAPGVTVAGQVKNLLLVSTLPNSVYAFDATLPGSAALWHVNFGAGRAAWSNNTDQTFYCSGAACNIGIVGTPAVDLAGGFLYVVTASSAPAYSLRKLSLQDGSTAAAVTIAGSVVGTGSTGDPTSGPNLLFSALLSNQRPGLVLSPDATKVYIAFGGGSAGFTNPPWHGWLFAYNTAALTQSAVFCTTPNGFGGSIWQSGRAPAVDASGNLYVATGSLGSWDGAANFSDSILKLSPSLGLLDWFSPSNHATLDANDFDLGANGVLLVPGSSLAVADGKDFNVYAVDTACMGHLQGSSGCALNPFVTSGASATKFSGSYGMAILNNVLFLPTTAGSLYSFAFSNGAFNTSPVALAGNTYGFPGPATLSGSANGASNGVLWVTTAAASTFTAIHAGTLRALNPSTLAELWNSDTSGTDILGNYAKFVSPTIAAGKVFVATEDSSVVVFGLSDASTMRGAVTLRGAGTLR